MGIVIDRGQLADRLAGLRRQGQRVVLTNGSFDLLHAGHARYLREAASLGDVLVVGLNSDASVRAYKDPGRPIVPQADRAELLAALEVVDFVTIFEEKTAESLVAELRPDVYVKGGDYRSRELPEARIVEGYGGQVRLVTFVESRSTSGIVERILQRYCPGTGSPRETPGEG